MTCASRRKVPGCVPDVRVEVPRDLNTDISVFDWHARLGLATRWRLAVAKGLRENCRDVGRATARKIHTVNCQNVLARTGPAVWKVRRASGPVLMSRAVYGLNSVFLSLLNYSRWCYHCRQSYNIINDILPLVYFKFASQIVPDILLLIFVNMPNSHSLLL